MSRSKTQKVTQPLLRFDLKRLVRYFPIGYWSKCGAGRPIDQSVSGRERGGSGVGEMGGLAGGQRRTYQMYEKCQTKTDHREGNIIR